MAAVMCLARGMITGSTLHDMMHVSVRIVSNALSLGMPETDFNLVFPGHLTAMEQTAGKRALGSANANTTFNSYYDARGRMTGV